MNEKTLIIVKRIAKPLSIVNTEGKVTFTMKDDIRRGDTIIERPNVMISTEFLEKITEQEIEDNVIISQIEATVDIIS